MRKVFMVLGTDKVGMSSLRQELRPAHRAYLRRENSMTRVVLAGPTFDNALEKMNGTLLIIEARSAEDVRKFINDDPYMQAEIFQDIKIRPWVAGSIKDFTL